MAEPKLQKLNRILIVEDEPDFLELLQQIFSCSGWQVDVAVDGREGLRMIAGQTYDIILSDIEMPYVGGIEFLSEIRATVSNCATITILMSGAFKQKDIDELVGYNLSGFIEKPFDHEILLKMIDDCLQKKSDLMQQLDESIHDQQLDFEQLTEESDD